MRSRCIGGIWLAAGLLLALASQGTASDAPPVPADAFAFVQIRPGDLLRGGLGKSPPSRQALTALLDHFNVSKRVGLPLEDIEQLTLVLPTEQHLSAPLLVVTARRPLDREKLLERLLPDPQEHQYKGQWYYTSKKTARKAMRFVDDRTLQEGTVEDVVQLLIKPPRRDNAGPLAVALRWAEEKHHVVVGVAMREDDNQPGARQQLLGQVPDGELKTVLMPLVRPLFEVRTLALRADLAKTADVRLQAIFADEKTAKEAVWTARDGLALGRLALRPFLEQIDKQHHLKTLPPVLKHVETGLRDAVVEQRGCEVKIALPVPAESTDLAGNVFTMLAAISWTRQAKQRTESVKNLVAIGQGLRRYHDKHGTLPTAAITSTDGKPLLSWRVAILPYIGQAPLYERFKLDEPWDSPTNKKLLADMPQVFAPVLGTTKQPGSTYYQVFSSKSCPFANDLGLTFREIDDADGRFNTLAVVEGGEAIPWTKPDGLVYGADKPLPKLGGQFAEGFHVLFCGGNVRFIHKDVDEKLLRALITWNGGETIDLSQLD